MAFIDFESSAPSGGFVDFNAPEQPATPRGTLAEIGTQAYAGATIDLPKMVGQAAQWMGADWGKELTDWSTAREAANPDLAPQAEGRGLIGRALSTGARALVPSMATMVPAVAAAPFGMAAAGAAGAAGAFGLFGASQAQETYDKLIKDGVSQEDAKQAGYINLLIEGGGETLGTMAGVKLLGVGAKVLGKMSPVQAAIKSATTKDVVMPFLKQFPKTIAVETGTEFGQGAGEALVENAYGAKDNGSPWLAGVQGAEAALGMTMLLAPFGLAGFAQVAKRNGRVAAALEDPNADPINRAAASKVIYDVIKEVNPEAAKAWGENSSIAISGGAPIVLDESFAKPMPVPTDLAAAPLIPNVDPIFAAKDATEAAAEAAKIAIEPETPNVATGPVPRFERMFPEGLIGSIVGPAFNRQDETARTGDEPRLAAVADLTRQLEAHDAQGLNTPIANAFRSDLERKLQALTAETPSAPDWNAKTLAAMEARGIIGTAQQEAQNAQAVRSDQEQTGQGSQEGQPGLQQGAVPGGGNLQLAASEPANVGGAPGGGQAPLANAEVAGPDRVGAEPVNPLAPKVVAGVPLAQHTPEQLRALASNPETPAATRHAAAAAIQAAQPIGPANAQAAQAVQSQAQGAQEPGAGAVTNPGARSGQPVVEKPILAPSGRSEAGVAPGQVAALPETRQIAPGQAQPAAPAQGIAGVAPAQPALTPKQRRAEEATRIGDSAYRNALEAKAKRGTAQPAVRAADAASVSAKDFDALINEVQSERKAAEPAKAAIIPTRAGVMVQPLDAKGEPVGQPHRAGERPTSELAMPDKTVHPGEFEKGDRVEFTSGRHDGRHGSVDEKTALVMQPLFGGKPSERSVHYQVKTDNGGTVYASPDEIKAETAKPERVVADIKMDATWTTPEAAYAGIGYNKQHAAAQRAKAARARTEKMKEMHRKSAEISDRKAEEHLKAYNEWEAKYPEEAAKIGTTWKGEAPATVAPVARTTPPAAGMPSMTLEQTKHTKTGADIWVVRMGERVEPFVYATLKARARRNDGIWSNFTKGFNFSTPAGAEAFMGTQTAAPKPSSRVPEQVGRIDAVQAEALGAADFKLGQKRVPPADMTTYENREAWLAGWDKANLAAPVPEGAGVRGGGNNWQAIDDKGNVLGEGATYGRRELAQKTFDRWLAEQQPKTAGQIAGEAAGHVGAGVKAGFAGLDKLFGRKGTLGTGPAFDEDTWAAARPHFQAAFAEFSAAGNSLKEFVAHIIAAYNESVIPYLKRWHQEQANALPNSEEVAGNGRGSVEGERTGDVRATGEGAQTEAVRPDEGLIGEPAVQRADEPNVAGRHETGSVSPERGVFADSPGVDSAPEENRGQLPGASTGVPDGTAGGNYLAPVGALARKGSWPETAARNVEIIKLVKLLESEARLATPKEQALIAQYTGFGASELANGMFPVKYDTVPGKGRHSWRNATRVATREIDEDAIKPAFKQAYRDLKEVLDQQEFSTLTRSTQYAHFTDESIVRSIWSAIGAMGFKGGRALEPGAGSGRFMMAAPKAIAEATKYVGIEMDHLTGMIAKQLLQKHNIIIDSFIDHNFPDNFFDIGFGNPPFAGWHVLADPRYRKLNFLLHDFFFAKTIDRIRPGGLMVLVTSAGTMNKLDDAARNFLSERADLLGAIRLPQTAFKQDAGTEVVTDVIFLQKSEPGTQVAGEAWNQIHQIDVLNGQGETVQVGVNEYFVKHPEMVLGRHAATGSMYRANTYTVEPIEGDIAEQFTKAAENLPKDVYAAPGPRSKAANIREQTDRKDFDTTGKKEGGLYTAPDGETMQVRNGVGVPLSSVMNLSDGEKAWLKDYVPLRDALKTAHLDQLQDGPWEASQKALQKAYRAFVKKHGRILEHTIQERKSTDADGEVSVARYKRFKWSKLLKSTVDVESTLTSGLEKINDENNKIEDGDILTSRVLNAPSVAQINTVQDALAATLNDTGKFDLAAVSDRIGRSQESVIKELGDLIYEDPASGWQLGDEYLSGNVLRKLEEAQAAAQTDSRFERNVDALIKVQPEPVGPQQIEVRLGANWVPDSDIRQFTGEALDQNMAITYDIRTNIWTVPGDTLRKERSAGANWGTADRSPAEILSAVLNNHDLTVRKTDSDKKTYVDKDSTAKVNDIAEKMRSALKAWIWTDAERAKRLLADYNRRFNNLAPRKFDGSFLTLPGLSMRWKPFAHQLRTIWRIIQEGNTYVAHAVGAGKTMVAIISGMEQKRLGMIKRPMYVVPNHMLEQFTNEFMEFYPAARVLVADKENFIGDERRRFVSKAALGNWDAIIIKQSSFALIGTDKATREGVAADFLADLNAALSDVAEGDRTTRKRLEAQIEAFNQRVEKAGGGDTNITFEKMGVDFLYVDEAHMYRKLDYSTNNQIKGIDPVGSLRAFDLFVKLRHLDKVQPGRNVVMMSGTPITNTVAELYTIQRFMNYNGLVESGLNHFDAWAATYGAAALEWERDATGKFQAVNRFSKFVNVPEMMMQVRDFMDVLTMDQLGTLVDRPTMKTGRPQMMATQKSPALEAYMQGELAHRLEVSKKWKPSPQEKGNPDPVINIITDGRLSAIDMRFVSPGSANDPSSKLNLMIDHIIGDYNATKGNAYTGLNGETDKLPGASQIVFSALGFGEMVAKNRGFDAKGWVLKRLEQAGIPKSQVAFMGDYNTDAKKEAMFAEMRDGRKRILIGSPQNMGTGLNVQKRLASLHYLAPPWYPADVEQPHGRILRQGNQNTEADIRWYVTEGTYDSSQWGMVRRKGTMIESAFSGDKSVRTIEDLSEVGMYALAEAIASGDDRVIKLASLKADVERFERLRNAHFGEQQTLRRQKSNAEFYLKSARDSLGQAEKAVEALGEDYHSYKSVRVDINGVEYSKPGESGAALIARMKTILANNAEYVDKDKKFSVGEIDGQKIIVTYQPKTKSSDPTAYASVQIDKMTVRATDPKTTGELGGESDTGFGQQLRHALDAPGKQEESAKSNIAEQERTLRQANSRIGAPFEYENALAQAIADAANLENDLTAADKQAAEELKGSVPTAEEKAALEAKARTDLVRFINGRDGVVPIEDYTDITLDGLEDIPMFVSKIRDEWAITHTDSGLRVEAAPTKKQAIEEGNALVKRIGSAKIREKIAESMPITQEQKEAAIEQADLGGLSNSMRTIPEGYADPLADEADVVQNAIEGKTVVDVAKWISETAPRDDYSLIAEKVSAQLKGLQTVGMKFTLNVSHVGDRVPASLIGTRGQVSRAHGSDTTEVRIQGADVTGHVGTSYETVLHELLHAATQTSIYVGKLKSMNGSKLQQSVIDLRAVSNYIVRHINKRISDVGRDESKMAPFERKVFNGVNNALTDEGEVISWALTNREFQEYLDGIPYRGQTLWQSFVQAVRKMLGLAPSADTALSEILRITDDILSTPLDSIDGASIPTQINRVAGDLLNNAQGQAPYNIASAQAGSMSAIQQSSRVSTFVGNLFNSPSPLGPLNWIHSPFHKGQVLANKGMPGYKRVFERLQMYLNDISGFAIKSEQLMPSIMRELKGIMPKDFRTYFKGAADEKDIAAIGPWLNHGTLYGGGSPLKGVVWTNEQLRGKFAGIGRANPGITPLTEAQIPLYHQVMGWAKEDKEAPKVPQLGGIGQSLETSGKAVIYRHVAKYGISFDRDMSLADVSQVVRDQLSERVSEMQLAVDHATEVADSAFAEADRTKQVADADRKNRSARLKAEEAKVASDKAQAALEKAQADMGVLEALLGDNEQEAKRKVRQGEKANPGTIRAIEQHAQALIDHGYMPLKRFGSKTVTALDAEGKTRFFGAYDGKPLVPGSANAEMHNVAQALKELHPDWTIRLGTRSERSWKMYEGLSLDALENFLDFLDPETKADLERDKTIQEYLRNAVNDRSVLKQLIHRKGTPGFSTDVPRIIASFITQSARNASGLYHIAEAKRMVGEMTPANGEQGAVQDEAADLVDFVTKPGEDYAKLRSFLFFNFLGGSIASAAINLSQTVMMTAPYLAKYTGAGNLTSTLLSAAKLAVGDPAKMSGQIGKDLMRAEVDGVTAPQAIYHLTAMASNNPFSSDRRFRTAMAVWNGMFGAAEVFNRRVAFIAAHDIFGSMTPADRNATGFKTAYDFAKDAVDQTQLIYNKGNRPNAGRTAVGAVVMTFKTFSIGYLELLSRLPPKQQLMMLGVLLLAAGGEGLPFAGDVEDLIDTLGQWLGFTTNTGKWTGKAVRDTLGSEFERPILKGLGGLLPIDLHSRLGMPNLIPGTSFFKPSEINKGRDVAEAVGPIGSVVESMMNGLQLLARGKWDHAAVMAAPKAARDFYNGIYMGATGETQDTQGRLGMKDVTGGEAFGKFVGFNPQRAAREGEAKREEMLGRNLRTVRMDEISSDWADGILRKDQEKAQAARDTLRQWNKDNPEARIDSAQIIRSVQQRVRNAKLTGEQRFLKSMPKPMRQGARESLQQ